MKRTYDDEETQKLNNEYHWKLIETYFGENHLEQLVRHQLESYNEFVNYQLEKTIHMFHPIYIKSEQDYDKESDKYKLEMIITFSNFQLHRPQIHENNGAIKLMFPQEARLRNFTYSSSMTFDLNIKYITRNGNNLENSQIFCKKIPSVHIGKMPVMLKSSICLLNQYKHIDSQLIGECKYDAGGYFIINGSEKTVLGQERAAENRVYCFNIEKNNTKYKWSAEIKSVPDFKTISPKQINLMITSKNNNGYGNSIHIQIPRIKIRIPLFTIFKALGIINDKEICKIILLTTDFNNDEEISILAKSLKGSIYEAGEIETKEQAFDIIKNNVIFTPINMD